jgi:hypothetical protein
MKQISLEYKFFIFYKTLSILDMYSAHWDRVPGLSVEKLRKDYAKAVKNSKDRYEFYLVMSSVMARLRNRHTWYTDRKIWKDYGMGIGFEAIYHDKLRKWIVTSSKNHQVPTGSVITKVNGIPTNNFFNSKKQYIPASNERAARNNLFSFCTYLPISMDIELDNKIKVHVHRKASINTAEEGVSHKVFKNKIGYIKIPSFSESRFEKAALRCLSKMKGFSTIIIDLRNNDGGATPWSLLKMLMDKDWQSPFYLEAVTPTALEKQYSNTGAYAKKGYCLDKNRIYKKNYHAYKSSKNAFKKKLIILTNESTLSAAEDFLIPLKYNKRAIIIGSRTNGSDGDVFFHNFDKDISIRVGCVSVRFPDGKRFEGFGISPDIEVYPKLEDIRMNIDTVLKKALEIAE